MIRFASKRAAMLVAACGIGVGGAAASAELMYGVTDTQTLITIDSTTPGTIESGSAISGLQPNEIVRGIDFRPATGQLFALGSFSNLYTIDTDTGAATQVGGTFPTALDGASFGFDFNPTIDRIRVTSDADQNLVLNPNTGDLQLVATPLAYGGGDANEGTDPDVVGSAYTNSFAGATMTQLYGIDASLDILVTQANNDGTLGTVGALGVDITDQAGFDISGDTGIAYVSVTNMTLSESTLWTVDLATGEASLVGQFGGGSQVNSIAVIPAPAGAALLGLPALAAVRRRRG